MKMKSKKAEVGSLMMHDLCTPLQTLMSSLQMSTGLSVILCILSFDGHGLKDPSMHDVLKATELARLLYTSIAWWASQLWVNMRGWK